MARELVSSMDERSSDYIYLPIDPSRSLLIRFPWGIILEKGAIALAEALGGRIGAGIGDALVDAIFGKSKNDGAFEREVLTRLAIIEQKLDEILTILRHDLPVMIDHGLVQSMADRAKGHRTQCRMVRRTFEKSDSFAGSYFETVMTVAGDGIAIGDRHPEWAPLVIEIFCLAASCLSQLIHHNEAIAEALATMAEDYQTMIEPWIENSSETSGDGKFSYRNALIDAEAKLERARLASVNPQLINTEYYFAASGPFPVNEFGDPVNPANPANHSKDLWYFFPGYTHTFGDKAEEWTEYAHAIYVPIGTSAKEAALGAPHPLINWHPLMLEGKFGSHRAGEYFAHLVVLARQLKTDSVTLPDRVEELRNIVHSIENAVEACKIYRELK